MVPAADSYLKFQSIALIVLLQHKKLSDDLKKYLDSEGKDDNVLKVWEDIKVIKINIGELAKLSIPLSKNYRLYITSILSQFEIT